PTAGRGRPIDPARVLAQRLLLAGVAVDFRRGGDQDTLAEAGAVLEHVLGALNVGQQRVPRLLDDQTGADPGGKWVADVALVDELRDDRGREDRPEDRGEGGSLLEGRDIRARARREVVEHEALRAGIEEKLREVRADEAGAAGDEDFRVGRVTS